MWIGCEGFDEHCPTCLAAQRRKNPAARAPGLLLHADLPSAAERPHCLSCQAQLTPRGSLRLALHDLPVEGRPVILHLSTRRWRCPNGCTQPDPFGSIRHATTKLTRRLYEEILTSWLRGEAVRTLARQAGVSEQLLWNLLNAAVGVRGGRAHPLVGSWRDRRRLEALQFIGIDELFWRGQPLLVVMDLRPNDSGSVKSASANREHRLIDILPARDVAAVERFLRDLDEIKRGAGTPAWTPAIATDMWGDYRVAIRRAFSGRAIHVADRFHIALKITEDLDRVIAALAPPSDRRRESRLKAAARAYLKALGGDSAVTADPSLTPPMREAAELAYRIQGLWTVETPMEGLQLFRTWRQDVRRFAGRVGNDGAFARLIYLLDQDSWVIETLNAHRPEAKPVAGPVGTAGPLLTTARVERMIRRIRAMERRSPNHRRLPFAQEDQTRWDEEPRFHRYRARVLYALNTRAPQPAILQRDLQLIPQPCCDVVPDVVRHTVRRVADRPLMGARVVTHWEEGETVCPQCGETRPLQMPPEELTQVGTFTMRAALESHLLRCLQGDHALTALHQATGVPVSVLRTLRLTLPLPEIDLPAAIGVIAFSWRRQRCLLITDIATGRPAELLRAPEGDWTPDMLEEWLSEPGQAHVERVWVERPEWIPEHEVRSTPQELTFTPVGPQRVLDPFSSFRLIQKGIRQALDEYTSRMEVSVRRARPRYRVTLSANPDPSTWSVDERLRRREREAQWEHLTQDEGLQYALVRLHDLRARLKARPEETARIFREWRDEGQRRFAQAFGNETDVAWLDRVSKLEQALGRAQELAVPNDAVSDALILGLQLAASESSLTLARSRRRLRSVKELSLYRGQDWEQLRRVVLTPVAHD